MWPIVMQHAIYYVPVIYKLLLILKNSEERRPEARCLPGIYSADACFALSPSDSLSEILRDLQLYSPGEGRRIVRISENLK